MTDNLVPGWPGMPARWTSSKKSGVGTAFGPNSRVWFTLSHGILNEIYYPRVDRACIRDMGLIVTDGRDFFSEERRHTQHEISFIAEGVPAYRLVNTCLHGRYRIEKEVIADPARDVVLQRIRFVPLVGSLTDYHVYVLLAPHLGNQGAGNTAWVGDYKGVPMLFAERDGSALALASSSAWLKRSVGFVGVSDGWQDLSQHKQMEWEYPRAENGNVALTAEVDLAGCGGEFVLATGFGRHAFEAGHQARASLQDTFDHALEGYVAEWRNWQQSLLHLPEEIEEVPNKLNEYRVSTMVLHAHESIGFPGGIIASLSIPWGNAKGDNDLGGYHLVWARDLVEAADALLAVGAREDASRVLHYLQATQEMDGHWSQNMWLDGTPYWTGIQMDETAFPILLTDTAWREGLLHHDEMTRLWPMVRRAAGFIVRNGPVTMQDRWEEDAGYSPYTLAVEIAGLLAAADLADLAREPKVASYLRETADHWNANIEVWTYATGSDLATRLGVEGYYVRIAPPEVGQASSPLQGYVPIKNRPPGDGEMPAVHIVSPDALALVRFGLRSANDPRIVNTVKVIDALLKVETPVGPCWHRYDDDGYGEHADGSAFDGDGIGRLWPLLTGERAHYELAAGRLDQASRLLKTLEAFADSGGMLPEQIWDSTDIPEKELCFGRPSGSAMPLVWAHAEHLKLRRSLHEQRVFDMPPQPVQRYQVNAVGTPLSVWRVNNKIRAMHMGKVLRIETLGAACVHWSEDGWQSAHDSETRDTELGVWFADLPTEKLAPGATVTWTLYWSVDQRWEGTDYKVQIVE